MSNCYTSYKKRDLIKSGQYLLDQTCCDERSCSEFAEDLKDLQYKCNDMFGEINKSEADAKGNIKGTLCEQLKDKKNSTLEYLDNARRSGGKKRKRQTKKRKTKKSGKNIKKSRKYRRSKK